MLFGWEVFTFVCKRLYSFENFYNIDLQGTVYYFTLKKKFDLFVGVSGLLTVSYKCPTTPKCHIRYQPTNTLKDPINF